MQVLVTRRLTLRPPAMLDAEDIALWLSNWNVTRMLSPVPYPYARGDAEAWIASVAGKADELHYTVHRERLIGCVSIGLDGEVGGLGYWLGEPWHGRGFMTEAARALVAHAFETQGIRQIDSCVFADNPKSLRTQEKLGFTVTGTGELFSLARGEMVQTITTRLTAQAFASIPHSVRTAA
jgi:RimJ/RimL family protein N-acetyltransferase